MDSLLISHEDIKSQLDKSFNDKTKKKDLLSTSMHHNNFDNLLTKLDQFIDKEDNIDD